MAQATVQDLTQAYRRSRDARRRIKQLTQQLLNAADALGQAPRQQGYQRYKRLAAKSPCARARKKKGGQRS